MHNLDESNIFANPRMARLKRALRRVKRNSRRWEYITSNRATMPAVVRPQITLEMAPAACRSIFCQAAWSETRQRAILQAELEKRGQTLQVAIKPNCYF
jgi:dTDP-4-amino-4,6-dideoxygalactose transaminase